MSLALMEDTATAQWPHNECAQELPPREIRDHMLRNLGQQSAYVIHQLRSPLQGVQGQMQVLRLLLRQEGNTRHEPRLELISRELERLTDLADQYLQLGTLRPLELKPLQLEDICLETVQLLRSFCLSSRIQVELSAEEELPPVAGDEQRLRQLLLNLIVNSVQAMEQGGHLQLRLKGLEDGCQQIQVEDNGPGILPEIREQIFQPYFTTKPQGYGLGLAWCQQIAWEHDAMLSQENRPEGGAVFTLTLPPLAESLAMEY